jgi:ATP-dependent Clp protease ATP-binding subunit ClpA
MGLRDAMADVRTIDELLTSAERHALALGDDVPGAEHLLLAAVGLDEDSARRTLVTFGVDLGALRAAVVAVHAEGLRAIGMTDECGVAVPVRASGKLFRSTSTAQKVFQRAVELSKKTSPRVLRGGHVVLAICELRAGTVVRALDILGIDRREFAAAAGRCLEVP